MLLPAMDITRGTPISPVAPDATRDDFSGRSCRNGASLGPADFLARPNASSGRGHYRGTPISPVALDAPRDVFDGRFCRNGASPGPAFTLNLLKDFYRCRIRWFSA
jgi:hypothetical protein